MFTNKSSEVFYNKGVSHFEKGEYEHAINLFKQAIEKNSSKPQFYYNLGLAYVKTEEYDLAIANFEKAIALNPKDADALQNLGIVYYTKSQFEEAVQLYKKAIAIKSNDYQIYDNLGISYFSMNMYKDSIECFKKALELDKNNIGVASNLAYAYYTDEQYDSAKKNFIYAISLNDQDEEIYFNLGNVYLKLKEFNLAEENFKNTLSLNPEHEGAIQALKDLDKNIQAPLLEEEPQKIILDEKIVSEEVLAEKRQEAVLKKEAEKPTVNIELVAEECFRKAVDFLKVSELELAVEELNKALAFKNDYQAAVELLNKTTVLLNEANNLFSEGVSFYSSKDYVNSLECFKKALAIKPNNIQIKAALSRTQIKLSLDNTQINVSASNSGTEHYTAFSKAKEQEQYKIEVIALKKAIQENPKEPQNHYNLGVVYIKQKEYLYAIDSLKTTLLLNPSHKEAQDALYKVIKIINNAGEPSQYYYKLALIYIEKREYYRALDELKKILEVTPDHLEAKTLFSKIMLLMNKTDSQKLADPDLEKEIAKYQSIINSNPNDFEAYYKLGLIYSQAQNYDFAKEYFLKVLKLKSNHREAQISLYDLIKTINA